MSLLEVRNLGKAYRRYRSEWQRVASWFGLTVTPQEEQWVLRNVSFSVESGQALGIVGENGAGKSTLLKLITGTQRPTEGEVRVQGRIAAILELGMGFNPELSGRQNAYHGLGLMGYGHDAIQQVMPEVEAFAEIGEYFDQPVRTYSSGMQVRAAFAVATAFRPDILIVDEALSVGDAYFQHKSFNRIRKFRQLGTTLLIVSHDRSAIQTICSRALLFADGKVIKDGAPEAVMDYYNALIADKGLRTIQVNALEDGRVQTNSGTREARFTNVGLFVGEKAAEVVSTGGVVELRAEVEVEKDIEQLVMGYMIKERCGQTIYGTNTWYTGQHLQSVPQGTRITYSITFPANLGPGSYAITAALHSSESHVSKNYDWRDLAVVFEVVNTSKTIFTGLAWIEPVFTIAQSPPLDDTHAAAP